jgi:hypothetical protein
MKDSDGNPVIGKEYIFYCAGFKYQGTLIAETETHWTVDDQRQGTVHLPKGGTIAVEVKDD